MCQADDSQRATGAEVRDLRAGCAGEGIAEARSAVITDRDCGDECDTLHARYAVTLVQPMCPKCDAPLLSPARPGAQYHDITCPCGQPTRAKFRMVQY